MDREVRLHGFGEASRRVVVADGANVLELLRALDVPAESVLVFHDDVPLPADERVPPDGAIRVVRIVSGG